MNLSILQFNEVNISTRITTGVLNHQFLQRPYKEHFYKFKNFLPLAKEFNSATEYGELLTANEQGLCSRWGIVVCPALLLQIPMLY